MGWGLGLSGGGYAGRETARDKFLVTDEYRGDELGRSVGWVGRFVGRRVRRQLWVVGGYVGRLVGVVV